MAKTDPTDEEEHTAFVKAYLTEVLEGRDVESMCAFVGNDVTVEAVPRRDGRTTDIQQLLRAANIDLTIERTVAEDDWVAVWGLLDGRMKRDIVSLAERGSTFSVDCVWFATVREDEIVRVWSLPDGLELLQQVGAGTPHA